MAANYERNAEIIRRFGRGDSFAEIAEAMGGISRGAVAGVCWRYAPVRSERLNHQACSRGMTAAWARKREADAS